MKFGNSENLWQILYQYNNQQLLTLKNPKKFLVVQETATIGNGAENQEENLPRGWPVADAVYCQLQ